MRNRIRAYRIAVLALCWAMAASCFGDEATEAALAEETGQIEPDGDSAGAGMVIELDDTAPVGGADADAAAEPPLQQQELADSDVEMIIGNGYAPNHAEFTLDVYRKNAAVRKWFDDKFGG